MNLFVFVGVCTKKFRICTYEQYSNTEEPLMQTYRYEDAGLGLGCMYLRAVQQHKVATDADLKVHTYRGPSFLTYTLLGAYFEISLKS